MFSINLHSSVHQTFSNAQIPSFLETQEILGNTNGCVVFELSPLLAVHCPLGRAQYELN